MEEQRRREVIEPEKDQMLRSVASNSKLTVQVVRLSIGTRPWTISTPPTNHMHMQVIQTKGEIHYEKQQHRKVIQQEGRAICASDATSFLDTCPYTDSTTVEGRDKST